MSAIARVVLRGTHSPTGQDHINRFFYLDGGGGDWTTAALSELADAFEAVVVPGLIAQMSDEVSFTEIEAWDDALGLAVISAIDPPITGALSNASEVPKFAMKFQLTRFSTGVRSGLKFLSGLVASDFNSVGQPEDGTVQARLDTTAAALEVSLTIPLLGVAFPVLVAGYDIQTGAFVTFSGISEALFAGLSSMNSRGKGD